MAETLTELVTSLSPEEQDAVREFIQYLRKLQPARPSPFLAAVDEVIDQHPELLRRLAQ